VENVARDEEPESDGLLRTRDRLRRPAALRTSDEVRRRGWGEPQATARTANAGHNDPFVAVAMANRLSAPLSENVGPESEKSVGSPSAPTLAGPNPRPASSEPRYSEEAVSTARCLALALVQWLNFLGSEQERCQVVEQTHEPGPGRSTSDAAFTALTKDIAQRNERAQKEARKVRSAREQEQVRRRRQEDLR
jgi:hypothetical protein